MPLNLVRHLGSRPISVTSTLSSRTSISLVHPVRRTYAATSQASPGQSSNVKQPTSDSAAESDVKYSRATDSDKSPDTASVQNPVSETSTGGQDEEGTDPIKQNPDKPAEEKAKETEKQGQTPLDPADK